MLTSWKCDFCDSINDMINNINKQCCTCHNDQTQLSPIGQIMHSRKLLFDGFMRIKILSNLSKDALKIMTKDVLNLCSKFYTIHIISIMEECKQELLRDDRNAWMVWEYNKDQADMFALSNLSDELIENEEYFPAYKILKMLLKYDNDEECWTECHYDLGIYPMIYFN